MTPGARVTFSHPHIKADLFGTIESILGDHARVRWDLIGPSTMRLATLQAA